MLGNRAQVPASELAELVFAAEGFRASMSVSGREIGGEGLEDQTSNLENLLVTLQLILLPETLSTEAALELVDLVVQYLNVLLEIRVAVECSGAQFARIAVLMALCVMLEGIKLNKILISNQVNLLVRFFLFQ